jgi:hypothetical protein
MKTEIIKLISQWPSLGSAGRRTHCDRGAAISSQGWYAGNTRYVQSEDGLLVSRAGYPCEILS